MTPYRRFESAVPNRHGAHPSVFALANGLAKKDRLSAEDFTWWQDANTRAHQTYVDPTTVSPECHDVAINPGARS